jgi:hypothetical protein
VSDLIDVTAFLPRFQRAVGASLGWDCAPPEF